MTISNPRSKSRIFDSLPERVQSAIATYAELAELSPDAVITLAIARFLELESISVHDSHSDTESGSILYDLPTCLRREIENHAAQDNMPPEFVVELAIAQSMINSKKAPFPPLRFNQNMQNQKRTQPNGNQSSGTDSCRWGQHLLSRTKL